MRVNARRGLSGEVQRPNASASLRRSAAAGTRDWYVSRRPRTPVARPPRKSRTRTVKRETARRAHARTWNYRGTRNRASSDPAHPRHMQNIAVCHCFRYGGVAA